MVLGADISPHECLVQVADGALRISVADLRAALDADPVFRQHLLLYIRTFMLQTADTARANGRGTIEERLARWLLMYQDRLDSSEILVTHESLSLMLGVRRPSVTMALNGLQDARVIQSARGKVIIADRAGLEAIAGPIFSGQTQQACSVADVLRVPYRGFRTCAGFCEARHRTGAGAAATVRKVLGREAIATTSFPMQHGKWPIPALLALGLAYLVLMWAMGWLQV